MIGYINFKNTSALIQKININKVFKKNYNGSIV